MIDHDSAMGRYRIHLPASPVCGRWETMLVDALDQRLSAEDQAFFDQHRAVCANCAALLDQSSCGRQWLACLDTAPEPPGVPSGLGFEMAQESIAGSPQNHARASPA